jgi:hypothetical protein
MSAQDRLAALEALARENNDKIDELEHTNWLLTNYNTMQASEMSQLEEDLGLSTSMHNTDTPPSSPPQPQTQHQFKSPEAQRRQPSWLHPPGPPPTPFYLAAREAHSLQLEFVIPGFNGETLGQEVNSLDLAFILQQTLRRRGWGEVMITKGVEDFLECPMVKVAWK